MSPAMTTTSTRCSAALRHQTRMIPRRADEITAGGSIYWVIAGVLRARQRITAIVESRWDDDTRCAALHLDPAIIPVEARPTKPFQGWRYLAPGDAPPDIADSGDWALPQALQDELRALCLL